MVDLSLKAKNYFIIGNLAEERKMFDVACTNYFKSLAAINDFVLSKIKLFPKDHNDRFLMLKEKDSFLYKLTSSLFLVYRRAYTSDLGKEEAVSLRLKLIEAFKYAKIEIVKE
ncbi:MAG: hypothetical protein WC533_04395 [Candidatus Pacearchaeota archaeon]